MANLMSSYFSVDISTVFTSTKVSDFFSLKCATPKPLLANVVYKFTALCDTEISNIGETKRQLVTRVKEHIDPKQKNSAILQHLQGCVTCRSASIDNFTVLRKCNRFDVEIHEAFLIRKLKPSLNKKLYLQGAQPKCILNVFG